MADSKDLAEAKEASNIQLLKSTEYSIIESLSALEAKISIYEKEKEVKKPYEFY